MARIGESMSAEAVRKVARLSRLAIREEQVEMYRAQLAAVLGYIDRLREVDVSGAEPMANVGGTTNRFGADEPGATLSNDAAMKLAPERMEPFIRVPKVLEEGGGA